jgi:hypothetical protein
MNKKECTLLCGLIILLAISRLIPHPWNITPIGALTLFSGAYLSRNKLYMLPVVSIIIGDIIAGFYAPLVMIFVYLGFLASAIIGKSLLKQKRSINRLGLAVISAAMIFYLLSNFGMWLDAYPHTVEGMLLCYLNGLPYLGKSLLGDAFYVVILFGAFQCYPFFEAQHNNNNDNAKA